MSWVKRRRFSLENRIIKKKKKKRPEGKTKISVQQSRNVRLATIVSPIDRPKRPNVFQKKRERENFSPRPFHLFPAPRFFPRRFTFISAFLAFPLPFPSPALSSFPNFLFLHPFSTTFAYPAGAITTAGNKNVTERLRPVDANSREEDT